jgi:hypothetical protein
VVGCCEHSNGHSGFVKCCASTGFPKGLRPMESAYLLKHISRNQCYLLRVLGKVSNNAQTHFKFYNAAFSYQDTRLRITAWLLF